MDRIQKIYTKLLEAYGPQRWWPTTLDGELHPSYHGRKLTLRQKFEVCVGAILTQNTSWKNVEKAICALNKNDMLNAESLARAPKEVIARMIRASGYYNQKADRIRLFSKHWIENPNILSKNVVSLRKVLLSLKGIGPETADSIILYAADKPMFVVDAYTKRIFSRLGLIDEAVSYDEVQQIFMNALPRDKALFNEYHALIVEHAKRHCNKNQVCDGCPINSQCTHKI